MNRNTRALDMQTTAASFPYSCSDFEIQQGRIPRGALEYLIPNNLPSVPLLIRIIERVGEPVREKVQAGRIRVGFHRVWYTFSGLACSFSGQSVIGSLLH